MKNSQRYRYVVWEYQVGHSEMEVRVYDPEALENGRHVFDLVFQDVFYFEGPLKWSGTGFYTATDRDCCAVRKKIISYSPAKD